MDTTENIFIKAPALQPFTPMNQIGCDVCGHPAPNLFRRFIARIVGKGISLYAVSYCQGGLAPVEDINSPIEQMLRGGQTERRPLCGGVEVPHLHLKCNCCDHILLMATKPH